jgi:hypothetical protein
MKPPEADKFLRVKGVFSLIYDNEHIKKICKNFSNGGRTPGTPALNPPLITFCYNIEYLPFVANFLVSVYEHISCYTSEVKPH